MLHLLPLSYVCYGYLLLVLLYDLAFDMEKCVLLIRFWHTACLRPKYDLQNPSTRHLLLEAFTSFWPLSIRSSRPEIIVAVGGVCRRPRHGPLRRSYYGHHQPIHRRNSKPSSNWDPPQVIFRDAKPLCHRLLHKMGLSSILKIILMSRTMILLSNPT